MYYSTVYVCSAHSAVVCVLECVWGYSCVCVVSLPPSWFQSAHIALTPVRVGRWQKFSAVCLRQISDQISLSEIVRRHGCSPHTVTGPRAAASFRHRVDCSPVFWGGKFGAPDSRWRGAVKSWGLGRIQLLTGLHDCVNDWTKKTTDSWCSLTSITKINTVNIYTASTNSETHLQVVVELSWVLSRWTWAPEIQKFDFAQTQRMFLVWNLLESVKRGITNLVGGFDNRHIIVSVNLCLNFLPDIHLVLEQYPVCIMPRAVVIKLSSNSVF